MPRREPTTPKDPLVAYIEKVVAWLDRLVIQSEKRRDDNRGRFDGLADACDADAKNYRAVANDGRKALADMEAKRGKA